MAEKFMGLIPAEEWLDIGFQVSRPNDPFDGLIGDLRTENIITKWQSIASEYQMPIMAQFHGLDTEANKTIRIPVDTRSIKKGLIKVKINQSEMMQQYKDSGIRDDEMYDYVMNDGIRLADQVVTRSKVAKAEMLATGKVTIHENNLDLTVDYGVSENQTDFSIDLSAEADISGQIQDIIDKANDSGVILTGMITSRKNLTKMRKNTSLQKEIGGNLNIGALVSNSALNAYLGEEFGITRIITNDLTYGAKAELGEDGRPIIDQKRYFPDNKITFFASNPAGQIGVGLWGNPPEVDVGGFYPVNRSGQSPYVYVTQKAEWDPCVIWTKASGLFMPLLYNPSNLWIATVSGNETGLDVENGAQTMSTRSASKKQV